MRGTLTTIHVLIVTLALVNVNYAQITAPPTSPTLWSFLGVPQGFQKLKGSLANRKGKHPKLEPKPPVLALADLANLESPVAAIKKAAEVKAAEDLKPQKIKAIKYLAEMGCGCYDKDGSITDALIAATDDPTPDVRLAVLEEIHEAADGACCSKCGATCCCNEKMVNRLAEMAYLRDEKGCYVEPNSEIRAAAVKALVACCPDASPVIEISEELPEPDKKKEPDYVPEGQKKDKYQGEGDDAADDADNDGSSDESSEEADDGVDDDEAEKVEDLLDLDTEANILRAGSNLTQAQPDWAGVLVHVDQNRRIAHVHLVDSNVNMPVGTELIAYGKVNGQLGRVGILRVYQSFPGSVNVTPQDQHSVQAIVKGVAVVRQDGTQPIAIASPPVRLAPVIRAPKRAASPRAASPRAASPTFAPVSKAPVVTLAEQRPSNGPSSRPVQTVSSRVSRTSVRAQSSGEPSLSGLQNLLLDISSN